jgi:Holliday junction DNA helicase RuvB
VTLSQFLGQPRIKEHLAVAIQAAKARGESLGHVLLCGPEACGKLALGKVIACEMGSRVTVTSGEAIERRGALAAIVSSLGQGDVLLIDEIHRLSHSVGERLARAMKDYGFDILVGAGLSAKTVYFPVPRFTAIGATDQPNRVSARASTTYTKSTHTTTWLSGNWSGVGQRS